MEKNPKLKEAIDILKFVDHRIRSELKNREKANASSAEARQSSDEDLQFQDPESFQ
jgi:hypothetical protein